MIRKIFLLLFSLFLSFWITELILRLGHYELYDSPFAYVIEAGVTERVLNFFKLDPVKIYSLKTNANFGEYNSTDENGFRVHPHTLSSSLNPKVIITTGDSFTYGQFVKNEETFPAILEKNLIAVNEAVLVYNAGIPGYGADQTYLYTLQLLDKYKPSLIIWNFHMNDISDSDDACLIKLQNDNLQILPGYLNTIYLQGYAYQHLPRFITSLKMTNFLLYLPNLISKSSRVTPNCSGTLSPEQIYDKIVILIQNVNKKITTYGGKFLITLTPYQFYFDSSLPNEHYAIKDYFKFKSKLNSTQIQFLDTNDSIALKYDPQLFNLRHQNNPILDWELKVMQNQQTNSLARNLFLDDGFNYGWRHLNQKGNQILAEIVATKVIELFDN